MSIVITTGAFDILHLGHLNLLYQSSLLGSKLIVGINSDNLIYKYKKQYPLFPQDEREIIVKSLTWVTDTFIQDKFFEEDIIKTYDANIFTLGDDWKGKTFPELKSMLKNCNLKLKWIEYTKEVSSTILKNKIKKWAKNNNIL